MLLFKVWVNLLFLSHRWLSLFHLVDAFHLLVVQRLRQFRRGVDQFRLQRELDSLVLIAAFSCFLLPAVVYSAVLPLELAVVI